MSHEVVLTDRAVADFDATLTFYRKRSEAFALRWCVLVEQAVADLEADPERFAIASEAARLWIDLRQINLAFGRKPSHRLVFAIRPKRVVVYTVRGLAQADLTLDDLI